MSPRPRDLAEAVENAHRAIRAHDATLERERLAAGVRRLQRRLGTSAVVGVEALEERLEAGGVMPGPEP
jgi:hypothetical protein